MSISKRIATNTFFMIMDAYVGRLVSMIAVLLISNADTEQFGIYSFAKSFASLFIIIADLGIETITIRDVAIDKRSTKEYLSKIIPLKMILILICFATIMVSALVSGMESAKFKTTALISVAIIGRSMVGVLLSVFKGHELMKYVAISRIFDSFFTLFFVILLVKKGCLATISAGTQIYSMLIVLAFCCYLVVRLAGIPAFKIDVPFWKNIILQSWPIALGGLAIQIFNNTDVVILMYVKHDNKMVGHFASCLLIMNIVGYTQNAMSTALFPVFSRFFVSDKAALVKTYEKSFKVFSVVGLPFCAGGAALAAPTMKALFNIADPDVTLAFILVCACRVFSVYGSFYGTFATSIQKQHFFGKAYLVCAGANVLLNFALIPFWGMKGAAMATLISNAIIILLVYIYTLRPYHRFCASAFLFRLCLCLGAMAAVVRVLHPVAVSAGALVVKTVASNMSSDFVSRIPAIIELAISVPAGMVAYVISIFVFKPFSPDDLAMIKKAVSLKKSPA